ncbi:hypothetical protein MtrunA17_Chr4g0034421 [Medicago truncatula]|uniref:60S ribosomal export protein NMD3 OB-fold domain-containing protein n=1 Tax=Medicago truncatula TaxID=3880 RepID=A0A396I6J4_MEDTR|nr:hypothetical protein MtrunA17_Chr4g0034421 [Medicago truncatula]
MIPPEIYLSFFVEIVPIFCWDLIFLPPNVAASFSVNIGPIVICTREEMGENKEEVKKKQIIDDENDADVAKKYRLADDVVARVKDIGNNDTTFQIRTHLGRILKPDDHALGYDLSRGGEGGANTNTNNNLHAAILITKISYAEENGRVVAVQDKWESDYQLFLNYLQQDPKLIFNVRAAEIKPKATHMLGPS